MSALMQTCSHGRLLHGRHGVCKAGRWSSGRRAAMRSAWEAKEAGGLTNAAAPPAPKPKHNALVKKVNRALPPPLLPLLLPPLLPLLLPPLLPLLFPLVLPPPPPAALHTVGCRRGAPAACFSAAPGCSRGLDSAVRPLPKLLLSCSEVLASCSAGSLRGC